jgi:hypothetical protein
MSSNPFASFSVEIPKKYQDVIKKFCKTGEGSQEKWNPEFIPFERQIDFWFMAFLIAVKKELEPEKLADTYTAVTGEILSRDPKRIAFMQLTVLGITKNFDILANDREIFNYCLGLANAGIPHLIQILDNPEEGRPLWLILEELETFTKAK